MLTKGFMKTGKFLVTPSSIFVTSRKWSQVEFIKMITNNTEKELNKELQDCRKDYELAKARISIDHAKEKSLNTEHFLSLLKKYTVIKGIDAKVI